MEYKVCAAQYIYDYLGNLRNPRYFADGKNLLLRRTYRLSSGYNSCRQKLQEITEKNSFRKQFFHIELVM